LTEYSLTNYKDRTIITHFINPEGDFKVSFNSGAIVANGPTWGRHSEEWVIYMNFPVLADDRIDTAAVPGRIREILKLPDVDIDVIQISNWSLERTLATRYREGRIFLAGDAAHKRPPTTGLGLNTSVEDALNLSWKLAMVLNGKADASLLNTYEKERRPVALRNCDWAVFTFNNFSVLQAAVGMPPGQTEKNLQRVRDIFEDSEQGAVYRRQLQHVISTQDIEYAAHNIELGFVYHQGAVVDDGTPRQVQDPRGRVYKPTTKPGHRLPHAWLEKDDHIVSTHDLVGNGQHDFLLITDEFGDAWTEAAKEISKISGLRIATAGIKTYLHLKRPDLYMDREDTWIGVRELRKGGALLVRQDNFVAWRHPTPSPHPLDELSNALQEIIGRDIQLK
jgi:2,4-dichlorophenol 6-monooxygenase